MTRSRPAAGQATTPRPSGRRPIGSHGGPKGRPARTGLAVAWAIAAFAALALCGSQHASAATSGIDQPGSPSAPNGGLRRLGAENGFIAEGSYFAVSAIDTLRRHAYFVVGGPDRPGLLQISFGEPGMPPRRDGVLAMPERVGWPGVPFPLLVDESAGHLYAVHDRAGGPRLTKYALGSGTALPQEIAAINVPGAYYLHGALDLPRGYGYFFDMGHSKILKARLGAGDAPPTSLGATSLGDLSEDDFGDLFMNADLGLALLANGSIDPKLLMISLGEGDALPTIAGVFGFNPGEQAAHGLLFDAPSGYAYFTLVRDSSTYLVKFAIGDVASPPVRIGETQLPDPAFSEYYSTGIMDLATSRIYIGGGFPFASYGLLVIDPNGDGPPIYLGGAIPDDSAGLFEFDPTEGIAYALDSESAFKVDLRNGGGEPVIVGRTTTFASLSVNPGLVIDPAGRFGYSGGDSYSYRQAMKFGFQVDPFRPRYLGHSPKGASYTYPSLSGMIDPQGRYAYFGTQDSPGALLKFDISDEASATEFLGLAAGISGENAFSCAVIDADGKCGYLGTQYPTCAIVKMELGDGDAPPARVGSLQIENSSLKSAVIDAAQGYAFFGASGRRVVKVALGEADAPPTLAGLLALPVGESPSFGAVIDPSNGFAYFGSDANPASVAKIALGDGAAPPERVAALRLDSGEADLRSALIDPVAGFAYFGTNTYPGKIVKIALGEGMNPPERVGAISLLYDSNDSRLREGGLSAACIDPHGSYGYFATTNDNSSIVKVGLGQKGFLKATRATIPGPAVAGSVRFYSHRARGQVRLSIHYAAPPQALLWESGPTTNTAEEDWLEFPIASGAPPTLQLAAGDYWLGWQIDTQADIPSFTQGNPGDGLLVPIDFGPAPVMLDRFNSQPTDELWSVALESDLLPSPTPTISSTPTISPTTTISPTLTSSPTLSASPTISPTSSPPFAGIDQPGSPSAPNGGLRRLGAENAIASEDYWPRAAAIDTVRNHVYFAVGGDWAPCILQFSFGGTGEPPRRDGGIALPESVSGLWTFPMLSDESSGNLYAYHASLQGALFAKYVMGEGTNLPQLAGSLTLPGAIYLDGALDAIHGHAYLIDMNSRVVKVRLGAGEAPPTLVGLVPFPGDCLECSGGFMAIDVELGVALVPAGINGEKIVKIALGEGDALPTRIGELALDPGEQGASGLLADSEAGYFYFAIQTGGGTRLLKLSPGDEGAAPVRVGESQLPPLASPRAILDSVSQRIFVGGDSAGLYSSQGLAIIDPNGAGAPLMIGTALVGEPIGLMEFDQEAGMAYIISDDSVLKVDLRNGGGSPVVIGQTPIFQYSEAKRGLVIDAAGQCGYLGRHGPIGGSYQHARIMKLRFDIDPFRPRYLGYASAGVISSGRFSSGIIDPQDGYVYYGTDSDSKASVAKYSISNDSALPTFVGSASGAAGEGGFFSAVIDAAGAYGYFGTAIFSGASIVKMDLGANGVPPSRIGALQLAADEDYLVSGVIDSASGYAYFGSHDGRRILKIALGEGAAPPERVDAVQLPAGEIPYFSAVIDAPHGFAYFGTDGDPASVDDPASVVKVALGDGNTTFSRVGAVKLQPFESDLNCAAIDTDAGFAYFGSYRRIVKVALGEGLDPPSRVGAILLPYDFQDWRLQEWNLESACMDPTGAYAYFVSEAHSAIIKVGLGQKGFLKATRVAIPEAAAAQIVRFYSHQSLGRVRLSIHSAAPPQALLWESGPTTNTAAEDWLEFPIASGAPPTLQLAAGDYWLGWQIDTQADIASFTQGSPGDGLLAPISFGPAPAMLDRFNSQLTDERWSVNLQYNLLPSPTPTVSPTPTLTPTITISPTSTSTPTITPTESIIPTATDSATPTSTPPVTTGATPSATATATPSLTVTAAPSATDSPSHSPSATTTSTSSSTIDPSASPTATASPAESATASPSPTATSTSTPVSSGAPTETPTPSPSPTPTHTPSPAASASPSATASPSASGSPADSPTPTPSPTPHNDAAAIGHTIPQAMEPGQGLFVGVTMLNSGTIAWSAATGHALAVVNDDCGLLGGIAEIAMDAGANVAPGEDWQFVLALHAPDSPTTCGLRLRMIQTAAGAFGDPALATIEVEAPRNAAESWEAYE